MTHCAGFAPITPSAPKIMILGTMPSVKSIEDEFYYAHPRNAFWPIISGLAHQDLYSINDKISACEKLGILVWDVLASCHREGSLDSAISHAQANDFESFFLQHPTIKAVFFNGQAAANLFKKHVLAQQKIPQNFKFFTLTSSSPANARLKFQDKALIWEEKIRPFL